jgi:hypothetical protein
MTKSCVLVSCDGFWDELRGGSCDGFWSESTAMIVFSHEAKSPALPYFQKFVK